MRRWGPRVAVATVAAVALVLGVAFASRFGADPRLAASPLIGQRVPDVTVHLIPDGSPLELRGMRGQIVVVNFWAPWCPPCRAEHPDLVAVADAFADAGVRILGIAYQSEIGHVTEYLNELGWGYDVAMDERSRAAIGFGIRGVPETFFVDRDGLVVAKVNGPVNAALLNATIERILVGADVDEDTTTGTVQPAP